MFPHVTFQRAPHILALAHARKWNGVGREGAVTPKESPIDAFRASECAYERGSRMSAYILAATPRLYDLNEYLFESNATES